MKLLIAALSGLAMHAAVGGPIEDLKPGTWYQVPNSKLRAVLPSPAPSGNTGVKAIMNAWSGGAYDSVGDRLLVWGGGHTDYSGNELYAFDLDDLKWTRLSDPSTDVSGTESTGKYPDGLPRSTHTYNTLEYSPDTNRFIFLGMGGVWSSGRWSNHSGGYDLGSRRWVDLKDRPTIGDPDGAVVAYDPAIKEIWYLSGNDSRMSRYNPAADTWTTLAAGTGAIGLYNTAALDTKRRLLVTIGSGGTAYWDLANSPTVQRKPATSGATDIQVSQAPGFAYDPPTGKFVAWNGGTTIYTLDPATWTWAKAPLSSSNVAVPGPGQRTGTFGRFRYSPKKNVYVAVNDIDEDVFIYRLQDTKVTVPQPPKDIAAK